MVQVPVFLHPMNLMRSVVKGEGSVRLVQAFMMSRCTVYTLHVKLLKLGYLITMSIKET